MAGGSKQVVWVTGVDRALWRVGLTFGRESLSDLWALFALRRDCCLASPSRSSEHRGGPLTYGFDNFTTLGLFYLMIAPLPDRWSLDRWWHSSTCADTHVLGFHRRLLQVHLCLVYFFSGLTKSFGAGWWNGNNAWYALTLPSYAMWPISWVAKLAPVLPAIGIFVFALELSYPFLIWPKRTRYFVLTAICALHGAIGLLMGMWLFAFVMLVLNLAAFAVPARLRLTAVKA